MEFHQQQLKVCRLCVGIGSLVQKEKEYISVYLTDRISSKPLELMSSVMCIPLLTVIHAIEYCIATDKPHKKD